MRKTSLCLAISFFLLLPQLAISDHLTAKNTEHKAIALSFNGVSTSTYGTMIGMDVFYFNDSFGWYFNYKTNTLFSQVGEPYFDTVDVKDTVDPITRKFREADAIAIGTTWAFTPYLGTYIGLGIASNQGYAELYGPVAGQVGSPVISQRYFVQDRANTVTELFLDAGIILSYRVFMLQIGRNSLTNSYEAGVGFKVNM